MSHNATTISSLNGQVKTDELPDPQVLPKAERRHFNAEYKLRIVVEADACTERGQVGALLRREGLYSSHLDKWRKQRAQGLLGPQKRGRKPDPQGVAMARLRHENEHLQARLKQAVTIIEVHGKLCGLLGLTLDETTPGERR